ncbi:GATOR complex protein WDR24-like, partial [Ostrinia furnacalis]|uniref:GATOR complex protein WDR24-like n=1 Tax=Ostrinia furnacalis TaxID=93504 RepID=UPI00103FC9B5
IDSLFPRCVAGSGSTVTAAVSPLGAGSSPPSSCSTGSDKGSQHADLSATEEGEGALAVGGAGQGGRALVDVWPLLGAALRQHADLGDVQTAAAVMLALHEHRSDLFPYIDESLQEQWLLGYIELLQRHKLWNVATEVIRNAWLSSVWSLSQQSTSVAMCCGRCGRRTRPHAACDRCQPRHLPDLCCVCHQVVRGLYAWCQGCSHGGHLHHMRRWMERHQLCPAGCGHRCQL